MKKIKTILKSLVVCLALVIFAFPLLAGCGKKVVAGGIKLFNGNTDFSVSLEATADKINIEIKTNVKKPKGYKKGSTLDVVMLEPYEYYSGEADIGVNYGRAGFTYSEGEKIETYTVGETKTFSIDRYLGEKEDNFDRLYKKFVLAKDGKLAAGPFLVNKIESERTFESKVKPETKKGIIGMRWFEERELIYDLGCGWTEFNINPNDIVFPNEKPGLDENGNADPSNIIAIDNSSLTEAQAHKFVSDGVTYYFRKEAIDEIDETLRNCRDHNIKVVFILYQTKDITNDWNHFSYFMVYPNTSFPDGENTICAIDTSTKLGYGYYKAFMEFIAERYSREDGEFGYVSDFVIGNEIDLSWEWNPIRDYETEDDIPTDEYVEEYLRTFRLADQATKKYYSDSMVLGSTCHYWAGAREEKGCYASKDIYDYLNSKVTYEGNFNWGMASHPYPVDLPDYRYIFNEANNKQMTGDINTSMFITWTNLELLDLYLGQKELLYNGEMRRVFFTEGGVSSGALSMRDINNPYQAAGIAYAYYKASCMDSTEAFIYFYLKDYSDADPNSFFPGLVEPDGRKKTSYEVFKYMDTQYSFEMNETYFLKYLEYRQNGTSYTIKNGKITGFKSIMAIFESDFDWDAQWDTSKIMTRTATEVPPMLR